MTDKLKLQARYIERGYTQERLAYEMGISEQSFNRKINNKCEFKASEISALMRILNLSKCDVDDIFFTAV